MLNNLKEGVFVIDEAKDKFRFINEAGDAILKKKYLSSNKGTFLPVGSKDAVIEKT